MPAGQFGEDDVERALVFKRNESIVKDTQRLVTKQTKNLFVVADYARIGLQQTCVRTLHYIEFKVKNAIALQTLYNHCNNLETMERRQE